MIIFLYGSDTYRLRQNRHAVIDGYRAKHASGLNLFTVNAAAPSAPQQLADILKTNSFFNEVQLVVVHDVFHDALTASAITTLLNKEGIANDRLRTVVIIHPGPASDAKPKEGFDFLLKKSHLVRECAPLKSVQYEKWFRNEATLRGATFAPGALARLIPIIGTDSWQAVNIIEKLVAYCRGPISVDAINRLVVVEQEMNIFDFIDAFGSGNAITTLPLLYAELASGRDPYYIVSMIAYQLRTMLAVKDASQRNAAAALAAAAGVHPFVARKMTAMVAHRDINDLKHAYQRLVDTEVSAKNGTVDIVDALCVLAITPIATG